MVFRKAIPNSISLMFPMMLPLAREGPPVQGREGRKEEKKKKAHVKTLRSDILGERKLRNIVQHFKK